MLTRESFTGPWAGLPVAWTSDDRFDEATYRRDIRRCCEFGVPGVYSGGTTGEFYAMEFDEFREVARATVEECHAHGKPAMIGCSSTYTLGVMRRAEVALELGAEAVQVALPFWMEVGEEQAVPFFKDVARAADGLALSIYETTRAKRTLTLDQHQAICDEVPTYLMVKANAGTLGATPKGCQALSGIINVFVGEGLWALLGPQGAKGCCSSAIYWNPRVFMEIWREVERGDWQAVARWDKKLSALFGFLHQQFAARGFTDTAFDRLGGVASGFLETTLRSRGPYPSPIEEDALVLREWYSENFPEMLQF